MLSEISQQTGELASLEIDASCLAATFMDLPACLNFGQNVLVTDSQTEQRTHCSEKSRKVYTDSQVRCHFEDQRETETNN